MLLTSLLLYHNQYKLHILHNLLRTLLHIIPQNQVCLEFLRSVPHHFQVLIALLQLLHLIFLRLQTGTTGTTGTTSSNDTSAYNTSINKSKIKSNNNTSILPMNNGKVNRGNNNINTSINRNNSNNKKIGVKERAKEALDKTRKALLGETGKQLLVISSVATLTFFTMYFLRKWLRFKRKN